MAAGDDGSQCSEICGDGIKTGDEECDDLNQDDGDGCDHLCQLEPSCGDGKLADHEECDLRGVDGCSVECKVEVGWKCDQEKKTCETLCGDGVIAVSSRSGAAAEECDDANTYINDGCNAACKVEDGWKCQGVGEGSCSTVCGDGILKGLWPHSLWYWIVLLPSAVCWCCYQPGCAAAILAVGTAAICVCWCC